MDAQKVESNEERPINAINNKGVILKTPVEPNASTNITDLDDDCLEYLFKMLNLDDLLSVADSSKCFKQAVDLVYAGNYKKAQVEIDILPKSCENLILVNQNSILLRKRSSTLKLLRCFGHMIHDLVLCYYYKGYHWTRIDQHLDEYINKYCANSLNNIEMIGAPKGAMEHLTEPFAEIKAVKFFWCTLGSNITHFNKWFPQMQCLEIANQCVVTNPNCIDEHFPNLQHLKIDANKRPKEILFSRSNIDEVIRLNPQLRSLNISGIHRVNKEFIQHMNKHLRCLETLEISCIQFVNPTNGALHVKNVKNFTLHTNEIDLTPNIPLSFERLETFSMYANQIRINSDLLTFINRHRSSLSKVSLINSNKADLFENINKTELTTAMELLIEIDLGYSILTVDEAIDFLRICKKLKKFRFQLATEPARDSLLEHISSEWHPSFYFDRTQLER